ncbi:hypothetical protein Ancab_001588 [Ancistrocladus abbreviatus]
MEEENMMILDCDQYDDNTTNHRGSAFVYDDDDEGTLPGFRFHPTDEELISFYLRRKVEKKPISIELIKQVDIYKHDPWDLAKGTSVGDKEWYFYCRRGRKYRNSIRPNRVTGSGFWKATGIDRPIYSSGDQDDHHECIGLKKSLVYYRGSAGKGTKTDWMMHEFRLPATSRHSKDDTAPQDAEIWTLCRIFKRNKRYTPDWREVSSKKSSTPNMITKTVCHPEAKVENHRECYISFQNYDENNNTYYMSIMSQQQHKDESSSNFYLNGSNQWNSGSVAQTPIITSSYSSSPLSQPDVNENQFFASYGASWDDLSSVVEFAARTPFF